MSLRKIIHIDMDAFYASVEQRDNPELRGKPVAVGGSSERGVVAAASYEARKYGVRSAMPSKIAKRKCPDLIFVNHRFDVYKAVSKTIRDIFHNYTDLVEPLSLDEAYLDVTQNKIGLNSATLIARKIKEDILRETELTASAGISTNKFLAKVASDINKPNGLTLIPPEKTQTFIDALAIERFHGIGKVTAKKMNDLGIFTGKDLKEWRERDLIKTFGKVGKFYFQIANGNDDRPVNPDRIRKSLSIENTFENDIETAELMMVELEKLAELLEERIRRSGSYGKTLTLKVKFSDFKQITRSNTISEIIEKSDQIIELLPELVSNIDVKSNHIRLLGLGVSNLIGEAKPNNSGQLTLEF